MKTSPISLLDMKLFSQCVTYRLWAWWHFSFHLFTFYYPCPELSSRNVIFLYHDIVCCMSAFVCITLVTIYRPPSAILWKMVMVLVQYLLVFQTLYSFKCHCPFGCVWYLVGVNILLLLQMYLLWFYLIFLFRWFVLWPNHL